MACDGVGPSYTCMRLLQGMAAANLQGPFFVNRLRVRPPAGLDLRPAVPRAVAALPYRLYAGRSSARAARLFLDDLGPDDIAYLWPSVPLSVYRAVQARGVPIVGEGINTRMAHARALLDALYAAEGLPPGHGITDARIREEEEKLALTSALFAPSPGVQAALAGAPIAPDRILPTSYGTDIPPATPKPEPGRPLTVLFVGYGCIRKGLHQLLRAWARAGIDGRLLLAGRIEPAVARLCRAELDRADVETVGFVRDVSALYAQADIFVLPSFEEGDPLVTYEAAARGLPIIASPAGGGRLAARTDCTVRIDPHAPDSIAAALQRLAADPDARRARGQASRAAVAAFDWATVGRARAAQLRACLPAAG